MRKWIYLSLTLLFSAGTVFSLYGTALARSSAQAAYERASERLERLEDDKRKRRWRDQWEAVIAGFDAVIKRYPESPYAGSAMFKKAESFYGMYRVSRVRPDLDEAVNTYESFAAKYPDNRYAADALDRLGSIYLSMGDRESAAKSYYTLANNYSGSPLAQGARDKLAGLPKVEQEVRGAESVKGLVHIRDIRHWSNAGYTRVVIDLEQDVEFEAHTLKNPDRLFFDIKGAFINSPLKDGPIQIRDGLLQAIRASQYDSETVRVVLDLESLINYRTLMLPEPTRLVVDITGAAGGQREPMLLAAPDALSSPSKKPSVRGPKPDGDLSLAQAMGLCIGTIVIDPGHGGKDPGAVGRRGLKEKDVVLDIGLKLRDIVIRELGCKVVMTRDDDRFIDLDARPGIASKNRADVFISIHANASRNRRASGAETYFFDITNDRKIMQVAARENMMTEKKMSDLSMILKDIMLESKQNESVRLAGAIQAGLAGLKSHNRAMRDIGVKSGPFLVLYVDKGIPSILTEVGFISNPDEESLLKQDSYRQKVAEAIFEGIQDYISSTKIASLGPMP